MGVNCCVTSDHKFRGLKEHTLFSHRFQLRSASLVGSILCSESQKAVIKVSARLHPHLETQLRKNPPASTFSFCWQNLFAFDRMTQGMGFLLAVSKRAKTVPEAICSSWGVPAVPCHVGLSSTGCLLYQAHRESLQFQSAKTEFRIMKLTRYVVGVTTFPSILPYSIG